jgi:hypothetical protein
MRLIALLSICLATALLSGCAGYQLGPTNGVATGSKSIRLTPFSNQTMAPRLGDAVTTALRREIQRDGTYRLSTHGDADVVVTGVLLKYDRHELSFLPNDILTVRDFRVSVTAHVTARDKATGKTVLDRDVTGYTLIRVGSDMASSERQAMPVLAYDLAKNISALLVDGTW